MPASRWPYLVAYLAAVIAAEVLIAIPAESNKLERPFQSIGLSIHILLVFTLMFLSVVIQPKDATLAPLLVAASLASLVRVFSVAAVAYLQRLRPRDLGLALHRWPELAQQTAIALTGIPLGFLEFFILRPDAWIEQLTLGSLLLGGVVIFFATGFSEELIFRAILLKRAVEGLGRRGGLLYVTAIFASLHIFFLSGVDLVFVFAVGLFYGFIVLRTRNLWGVILSHSLGNVILYLVAPFLGR